MVSPFHVSLNAGIMSYFLPEWPGAVRFTGPAPEI